MALKQGHLLESVVHAKSFSYSINGFSGVDISAKHWTSVLLSKCWYWFSLVLLFLSLANSFYELRYKNRSEGDKGKNIETISYLQIYRELSKSFTCLNPYPMWRITLLKWQTLPKAQLDSFIHSFIHLCIHPFLHAFIYLLTHLSIVSLLANCYSLGSGNAKLNIPDFKVPRVWNLVLCANK